MTHSVFKSSEAIQKLCVKKKTKFKLLFNFAIWICVFKICIVIQIQHSNTIQVRCSQVQKMIKKAHL